MSSSSPPDAAPVDFDVARRVFGSGFDAAVRYAELLAGAGVERGLIGPRETGRLWSRHLLNSAVLGELIPADAELVDIGSGAGLPGIPLALARPDLGLVLLEPMQRRCDFLVEVVAELGLDERISVVRGRAPDAGHSGELSTGVAVSRAVAPLGRLTQWTMPLLRAGGVMLAVRGARVAEEVREDSAAMAAAGARDVDVARCGAGLLDEPTTVVRAVRGPRSTRAGAGRRRARTGGSR